MKMSHSMLDNLLRMICIGRIQCPHKMIIHSLKDNLFLTKNNLDR